VRPVQSCAGLSVPPIRALVVNAHHVKNVPGRETDESDAQWLAMLAPSGLLRCSFIPPEHLMGQRVYHKADLQASMERAWRLSIDGAVALPTFPGFKASRGPQQVSAFLPLPKPKPMGWRSAEAMKKASASCMPMVSEPPIEPINTRGPGMSII
jgi:hypothetical protein